MQTITIKDMQFCPQKVMIEETIPPDSVRWVNEDMMPHQIVSDDNGPINYGTGVVKPGEFYELELPREGVYHFHCALHPEMKCQVYVCF